MSTPSGVRIVTSTGVDVTEAVQALYDLAINSMDFGSGMWTAEDAKPVAELARICQFGQREEIDKYIADLAHRAEAHDFVRDHYDAVYPQRSGRSFTIEDSKVARRALEAHEHVLSSAGRCMWPGCTGGPVPRLGGG